MSACVVSWIPQSPAKRLSSILSEHVLIFKSTASRIGGGRVESEQRKGVQLIHNYGAGGAGYQSSWYVIFENILKQGMTDIGCSQGNGSTCSITFREERTRFCTKAVMPM